MLRPFFIIGLLITFISLFLEWFSIDVFNETGQKLLESNYLITNGWFNIIYLESSLLDQYVPQNDTLIPMMSFIQIVLLLGSIFLALFKNPETSKILEQTKSNTYFYLSTSFMNLLMIVLFPLTVLFPNQIFFPGMILENNELSIILYQGLGMGYILQCLGFILIFPYSYFCYKVTLIFEQKSLMPNQHIQMQQIEQSIDFDKLIAEEDVLINTHNKKFESNDVEHQVEIAYQRFQSQRKNKRRVK